MTTRVNIIFYSYDINELSHLKMCLLGICRQRWPRPGCPSVQTDLGFCCSLKESFDTEDTLTSTQEAIQTQQICIFECTFTVHICVKMSFQI